MLAGSIIKDFNVLAAGSLNFSMGSVTQAMVPLVLKTVKPALGRGIVPAVPFATHRAGHAIFLELVLKDMAGILGGFNRSSQHLIEGVFMGRPAGWMHKLTGRGAMRWPKQLMACTRLN